MIPPKLELAAGQRKANTLGADRDVREVDAGPDGKEKVDFEAYVQQRKRNSLAQLAALCGATQHHRPITHAKILVLAAHCPGDFAL
jgi:hypothetical protein